MTEPTLSQLCHEVQTDLSILNLTLASILSLARSIGLAPFRVAQIQSAMTDNQHAWQELNAVATALELPGADRNL